MTTGSGPTGGNSRSAERKHSCPKPNPPPDPTPSLRSDCAQVYRNRCSGAAGISAQVERNTHGATARVIGCKVPAKHGAADGLPVRLEELEAKLVLPVVEYEGPPGILERNEPGRASGADRQSVWRSARDLNPA